MRRSPGFSLVELLVVVALIAIVGAGVALTYGQEMVLRSQQQMTAYEMAQIRDAFRKFYSDNRRQLGGPQYDAGHHERLPSSAFRKTFESSTYPGCTEGSRLYGMLELFERYGLWLLLRPTVRDREGRREGLCEFRTFDPLRGEGWQGAYLSPSHVLPFTEKRDELVPADDRLPPSDVLLPQIGTQYGNGIYRIVYFEHCEDERDASKPIYRRLLLVCAEDYRTIDSAEELRRYAGNRRDRPRSVRREDAFPMDVRTGAVAASDAERGIYFTELLNLDTWER